MVHQALDAKNFVRNQNKRFICEIHRDMYEVLQHKKVNREKLLKLLFEAYDSGVKMSKKLHEYAGKEWIPDIFEDKK
jgi:hypothetical protein